MFRWRPLAGCVKSFGCLPGDDWTAQETAYPFTDDDLSPQQRSWAPLDHHEIFNTWPNDWKMEIWDGVPQFLNGSDPPWDWRAVAIAPRLPELPDCPARRVPPQRPPQGPGKVVMLGVSGDDTPVVV